MSGGRYRLGLSFALPGSLTLLVVLAACATTLQTPANALRDLGPNEGIVIGSVLIEVEKSEDESAWSWLKGRRIKEEHKWSLIVREVSTSTADFIIQELILGLVGASFSARMCALPGEPVLFITKLPAGEYYFASMESSSHWGITADLYVPFTVHPRQPTYVGRLVVKLPSLVVHLARFPIRVEDDREATLAWAREKYGYHAEGVVTNLMGGKGQNEGELGQGRLQ